MAEFPFNPQPDDVWDCKDSGSLYVLARRTWLERADVQVQRRPFGDSQAEPYWIRYRTFRGLVTDRLPRSRVLI